MDERYDIQQLLLLRKITRGISDRLRNQLKGYLLTLSPLLRPKTVLGDYVEGSTKDPVRGAEAAFKELQSQFEVVVGAPPFSLSKELRSPIEIVSSGLEITPVEYFHVAKADQENKTVSVTSPLKWVLSYAGFTPGRLKELLGERNPPPNAVREFVLHYPVMNVVVSRQNGVTQILEALHFPVRSERWPDFGGLPMACISSSISTVRPADDVIIESTEVSGTPAFEEIVHLESIAKMSHPLKDQLTDLVRSHSRDLLPG